jgi:hypothetical protein
LDPERAAFLTKRLQEAEAKFPGFKDLRRTLLRLGGLGVCAPESDPLLDEILAHGVVFDASGAKRLRGRDNRCYENVSRLCLKHPDRFQIVFGWALSADGLWRSHAWALEGERVVETTVVRVLYFGVRITAERAARFAKANT